MNTTAPDGVDVPEDSRYKGLNLSKMFKGAAAFNQGINTVDLGGGKKAWDTSAVTNMANMFNGATAFEGNISAWNIERIFELKTTFNGATAILAADKDEN
ncbi:MAG: BspA family leucine-rich repeat surface protein, partial [Spirochaetota bacterium]